MSIKDAAGSYTSPHVGHDPVTTHRYLHELTKQLVRLTVLRLSQLSRYLTLTHRKRLGFGPHSLALLFLFSSSKWFSLLYSGTRIQSWRSGRRNGVMDFVSRTLSSASSNKCPGIASRPP